MILLLSFGIICCQSDQKGNQNSLKSENMHHDEVSGQNDIFLFSYFVNERDGMYLAVSEDGLYWQALNDNRPVLKSYVGDSLLRDPSLVLDKNGRFHLVFTTSWTNLGFGYTSSIDLKQWEPQKFISVQIDSARNAWAPELFYDEEKDDFFIIWATAKRHIPTLKTGFKGDHRQYFITTSDFESFSIPQLLYEGHFSDMAIIDTYILHPSDSLYAFFFKVESTNLKDGGKDGIHFMTAPTLQGPYTKHQPIPQARGNAEGPAAIRVDGSWIVYYDAPRGAARSDDLADWQDITNQVNFPEGFRHGSVIKLDRAIIEKSFEIPFGKENEL